MAIVAPVPAISSPEHQPQQHIEVINQHHGLTLINKKLIKVRRLPYTLLPIQYYSNLVIVLYCIYNVDNINCMFCKTL